MLPTTTEGRAPLSPLHWRVLAGARQAELTGDWDFLGEHRKVLPLPALAELLGVESFETFAAHGAQGLAENGSWVQSARRLRSLSEPWSEVLVRAEATGAGGLAGTLGGLSARLSPDEARVSHPGWSTWSFSQHLTQSLSTPLRQVHDCMELAGQEIGNAAHVRKCLLWAEASLARAREVLKDSFSILEVLSRSRPPAFEALSLGACVNAVAQLTRTFLPHTRPARSWRLRKVPTFKCWSTSMPSPPSSTTSSRTPFGTARAGAASRWYPGWTRVRGRSSPFPITATVSPPKTCHTCSSRSSGPIRTRRVLAPTEN